MSGPAGVVARRGGVALWLAGLAVCLVLAGLVSAAASDAPDGLERVAQEEGFADTAEGHDLEGSPLADYRLDGVADDRWSVGLAGAAGVGATLALAAGVLWSLRRRPPPTGPVGAADDRPPSTPA